MARRMLLTVLGAGIGAYGLWRAASSVAWMMDNSWMPSAVGNLVGGTINIGAGVAVGYAAWRTVEPLPGALAGGSLTCSILAFAPWIVPDTAPLLGLPGYHLLIGVFTGIGVPIVPLGYVLGAVGLRLRDERRLGVLVWIAIVAMGLVALWYGAMFAMAPET